MSKIDFYLINKDHCLLIFFLLIGLPCESRGLETRSDPPKPIGRKYQSETRALGFLSDALLNTKLYT